MSFHDVSFSRAERYQNKGRLPGIIILVFGIALLTWFFTDLILSWQEIRLQYVNDTLSAVRLVLGVIFSFVGIWMQKVDDMRTLRP